MLYRGASSARRAGGRKRQRQVHDSERVAWKPAHHGRQDSCRPSGCDRSDLFDRSIAYNVAYASHAPDGQRSEDALRASGLDGLVRERGADFTVGSKGKFLSGGEQRRVALSRALYKIAPLYLLDEPTSELDPETSRGVIEQILRLKQSATIIAASHDATLIEKADVVVTL